MKKLLKIGLLTCISVLVNHIQTIAQSAKVEAAIQSIMQSNPVVGLSVAVVKNNKIDSIDVFWFRQLK